MDANNSPTLITYLMHIMTVATIILTLYATVNIIQSIRFRFWGSRDMDDRAKRESYVRNRYDVKWSLSFVIICGLGSIIFRLCGSSNLAFLELVMAFLFLLLWWGNCRTLNLEKERLNRKKNFGL